MTVVTCNIELNRVEGDLELQVDVEDGRIVDARCIGTLYRGFEQIMIGRAPTDALVITPRVCGICSTSHLYAAVLALEDAWGLPVPPNGTRVRDLCLMAETAQSDARQSFLMFTPDFCNPAYAAHPLAAEAAAAFEPFKGRLHLETLRLSKKLVEVVAIFGGQWPHSSHMVPGGVTSGPDARRLTDALTVIGEVTRWYERSVLGGPLDAWLEVSSLDGLLAWTEARPDAALGLFVRFARSVGLHRSGPGTPHLLSYGSGARRAGFHDGGTGTIEALDHALIAEDVSHSHFRDTGGPRHPWDGETVPALAPGGTAYSWAKAPRYKDRVVQTGPLAQLVVAGDPLVAALFRAEGANTFLRQFARIHRLGLLLRDMAVLIRAMAADLGEPFYLPLPAELPDGDGVGMVEAARGGLGHWVRIRDGLIAGYQIVTPTAFNASPRDTQGRRGHWEESLIGLAVGDLDNPVEVGHLIRSHDPCLVCTVHVTGTPRRFRFGAGAR